MGHVGAKMANKTGKMANMRGKMGANCDQDDQDSAKMAILGSTWEVLGACWEHFGTILAHGLDSRKPTKTCGK